MPVTEETGTFYTVTDEGPTGGSTSSGTQTTQAPNVPFDVDEYRRAQEAYYNSYGYQTGQVTPQQSTGVQEPLSEVLARQQLRSQILALLPEDQREIAKQFLFKKDLDPLLHLYFTVTSDGGATTLDPNITIEEARAAAEEIILLPDFQAKIQGAQSEARKALFRRVLPWIIFALAAA